MFTKEDILEEIRRTTKENGDIPLGIARLEDETGIKETDWERYWPRFSDAQKEAGVEPNTFLKSAFSDEHIYEKFILFSRELGKIPVNGELHVKHNNDSSFPSMAVFSRLFNRLGGKQKFLSDLLRYAESKNYKDIIKLCVSVLETESTTQLEDDTSKKETIGFVYLAKSNRDYKIGHTFNIDRRRDDITLLLPEKFEIIHVIKTEDPRGIEDYWHKRFESKRKRGEWFNLNSSDVKAFKRWRRIV